MATRKIRVTLSGTQIDDQGPIVDIDFNGVNLDADVDVNAVHGTSTLVKEYTVDVDAGTYNLDFQFKNDSNSLSGDRNFYVDKIEYANDGVNYESLVVSTANSNLVESVNFQPMGWQIIKNSEFNPELPVGPTNIPATFNPDYDSTQPVTDKEEFGYVPGTDPGANRKYMWEYKITPVTIFKAGTTTFNITFS